MLHLILYGKKGKIHNLKKNIGQFSGYVWVKNEEKQKAKVREKLDKCVKEKLMDFCDVLNITINRSVVKKEELTVKILEFLESPHSTTDLLLADKEQKGKKRKVSTGKNVSPSEASTTPAKRRKQTPQRGQKRKYSSKDEEDDEDKDESPDSEDNSEDDGENEAGMKDESDHEETKSEEEEDEPKEHTPSKKSKKSSKLSSVVKSTEKATHGKKSTPAKPVKSP
ncbi:DEK PROTEIN, partial [Salix koriyanagi]